MRVPGRPRTILFLISDTGAGHRSAANAIASALRLIEREHLPGGTPGSDSGAPASPPWHVVIVDAFAECGRFPLRKTIFLYGPATQHSPRLYGQLFRITNTAERFHTAYRLAQPFLRQGLRDLLLRTRPDVIVSVHPLLNHVTLQVLRDTGVRVPLVTVITDLVSIHCAWIARGVDACVVPTQAARALAVRGGMPAKRVHLLGMPIDPIFSTPPLAPLAERRLALGLAPDLPVILLVGGGEGAGGLAEAVRTLAMQDLPAQLLVVTGRNQQLYGELLRARARFRLPSRILGFVGNMPELMRAADVLVTKAGPGAISEAIACELPIVLTGAVPGQEEGNIDYVLDEGIGVLADSPDQLVEQLHILLDPQSPAIQQMRANVRHLSRPRAALDIARLIVAYLPPPQSAPRWALVRRARPRRLSRLLVQGQRTLRQGGHAAGGRARRMRGRYIRPLGTALPTSHRVSVMRTGRLARLAGARSLLLRGTSLGKVQLRRTGGR